MPQFPLYSDRDAKNYNRFQRWHGELTSSKPNKQKNNERSANGQAHRAPPRNAPLHSSDRSEVIPDILRRVVN
jgi:hypothetical protein